MEIYVAQKRDGDKATRYLVIGMIIFVLIVGVAFTVISNNSKNHVAIPASVSKADGYGIVYNATKKPVIDIWEDFQCPICRQFESVNNSYIDQVVRAGKAKVVFHTMSFIGPESISAAAAGACAADSGKYLEFHSTLYRNQPSHENTGAWTNQALILLGGAAGITDKNFISCVNDGKYLNWTKNVEADAQKKNVNATPTIFVNGKELNRKTQYMDATAFKAALSAAGVA
jgi:protein-disulfide isomerase